ncbi:zinc transporter ZupT [compost metagenome]
MILATLAGSITSFVGGLLLLRAKKRRQAAILLTLPFGAGALLAAAFFDLLPEAFELGDPRELLLWTLAGFTFFFLLERSSSWFHHHHEHDGSHQNAQQRRMIVIGDIMHNAIDGLAIGAAFLVSVPTGVITAMAVSAHEIPKELGTFALLLSRGWKGRTVVIANVLTALATVTMALLVFGLGSDAHIPIAPLLALTAGFFIYVAASDIIPEIHEQPHRTGTIQAAMLVSGIVVVGTIVTLLGV